MRQFGYTRRDIDTFLVCFGARRRGSGSIQLRRRDPHDQPSQRWRPGASEISTSVVVVSPSTTAILILILFYCCYPPGCAQRTTHAPTDPPVTRCVNPWDMAHPSVQSRRVEKSRVQSCMLPREFEMPTTRRTTMCDARTFLLPLEWGNSQSDTLAGASDTHTMSPDGRTGSDRRWFQEE